MKPLYVLLDSNGQNLNSADFEESVETVIAGYQRKGAVISTKEKLIVSYHEIGHALRSRKTKNSAPVHKITIIPRTQVHLAIRCKWIKENTF